MSDEPKGEPVATQSDADLLRENATLRAQMEQMKADYQASLESLQEHMDKVGELQGQLNQITPIAEKAAELEQQVFGLEAKQHYSQIADELKIDPKFRDDVFKLADFKSDGKPDPAAIKAHVAKFVEGKPHYLAAQGDSGKTPVPGKLPADPFAGRGPEGKANDGRLQVTRTQLNDPNFTSANSKQLAAMTFDIVQ